MLVLTNPVPVVLIEVMFLVTYRGPGLQHAEVESVHVANCHQTSHLFQRYTINQVSVVQDLKPNTHICDSVLFELDQFLLSFSPMRRAKHWREDLRVFGQHELQGSCNRSVPVATYNLVVILNHFHHDIGVFVSNSNCHLESSMPQVNEPKWTLVRYGQVWNLRADKMTSKGRKLDREFQQLKHRKEAQKK